MTRTIVCDKIDLFEGGMDMLETLKKNSMIGLIILLAGFTYIKTLPYQGYQEEEEQNNLFLYVEDNLR